MSNSITPRFVPRVPTAFLGAATAALLVATSSAAMADENLADLVEEVSPAVVTVLATDGASGQRSDNGRNLDRFGENSPFEDFFRRFGEEFQQGKPDGERQPFGQDRLRQGIGSGFILDEEGYIVTNHHVIDDADAVTVRLDDRREFTAEIVGSDPQTDLALLKVDAEGGLPYVALGDSDAVRVGEDVFAVGNPFGLGGTVTTGIVSATGRNIHAGPYADFIQTDAAINRGNSGGPLFNMDGEVIGVNSAIYSPTGGSVGIGFAVASNIVTDVVEDLKEEGRVSRGWLGVTIQDVTPSIAKAMDLETPQGALIASVLQDGPSAGALEPGDVVVEFGGLPVESSRDLPKLVGRSDAGERVSVELIRNGEERELELEIGALPNDRMAALDDSRSEDQEERTASESLGATLARLTPEARTNLGLEDEAKGVVITSLEADGAAARSGLRVGDVIVRLGDRVVENPAELDQALSAEDDKAALLLINRRGSEIFVGLSLT